MIKMFLPHFMFNFLLFLNTINNGCAYPQDIHIQLDDLDDSPKHYDISGNLMTPRERKGNTIHVRGVEGGCKINGFKHIRYSQNNLLVIIFDHIFVSLYPTYPYYAPGREKGKKLNFAMKPPGFKIECSNFTNGRGGGI